MLFDIIYIICNLLLDRDYHELYEVEGLTLLV